MNYVLTSVEATHTSLTETSSFIMLRHHHKIYPNLTTTAQTRKEGTLKAHKQIIKKISVIRAKPSLKCNKSVYIRLSCNKLKKSQCNMKEKKPKK